jgi:hypothetical protein
MYREGHKSPLAALRYQHAAQDRDELIADALGALATGDIVHLRRTKDGQSSGESAPRPGKWTLTKYNLSSPNGVRAAQHEHVNTREQPQRDSNPCRHLERVNEDPSTTSRNAD